MDGLDELNTYCDQEMQLLNDEIDRLGVSEATRERNEIWINNDQVAITTLQRVKNKIASISDE